MRLASTRPITVNSYRYVDLPHDVPDPLGRKVVEEQPSLRVAVITNWGDQCGIATYTKFLVDALAGRVDAIKIFAERSQTPPPAGDYDVEYCWRRGESLHNTVKAVQRWRPTVVLVQHEFGIFPKATYLLQLLNGLADLPYVVTLHSVYEHLDKTICSSAMKNIVVHSETGRACLARKGHTNKVWMIPHGCVVFDDVQENWNIFQTPHTIVQFGFGFTYKGVDRALTAIAQLKHRKPDQYSDIFYCYLCSENQHVKNVNDAYYRSVIDKIDALHLEDNAVVLRGFHSEETLNNYLRTAKIAVFPYQVDPRNVVYGASGAARVAMANRIPVVASASHMFDDLDGVVPRPATVDELAVEFDRIFGDSHYRRDIIKRQDLYVRDNTWATTADRYLGVFREVIAADRRDAIVVKGR